MNHKTTILPLAMAAAVALAACSGPKPEQLTSCTENPVAKEFLETASYPDGDYSESAMPGFDTLKTAFRKDQPSPITVRWNAPKTPLKDVRLVVSCGKKLTDTLFCIPVDPGADSALVYNLVPGKECAFRVCGLDGKGKEVVLSRGTLQAEGPLRMIYTDALNNVRDLGGWKTADGKTIRYGLIFRGGQLNRQTPPSERDIDLFKRVLGIRNDVDLRWDSELDGGTPDDPSDDLYFTPLGEGVEYVHMPVNLYALGQADTTQWNNLINHMLDKAIAGEPSYVHCAAGADRTGTTCFLLEGVLGVTEESLAKDYELTSFSIYGRRTRNDANSYRHMVTYLLSREGETLRDKFENYFTEYIGISAEKIEAFRAAMLE